MACPRARSSHPSTRCATPARGGIAELVSDGIDGQLVEDFRSPRAWADALMRLAGDSQLLRTLRPDVSTPATMDRVATDMVRVYEGLVASRSRPSSMTSVA